MNLLPARLAGALRQHRSALPLVMLRKLLPAWCSMETLILLRQSLHAARTVPEPRLAGLAIQQIHATDVPLLKQLCAAWPDKAFAERLAQPGRYCWVVLQGGRIAGYAWVACLAQPIDEIGCDFNPVHGECYIHDCFVVPACRGAGLYPYLLARVLQDCSTLDGSLRSAVIGVVATNQASLRGIRKAGFSAFARILHLQCGSRRWWWGRPARQVSGPAIQVRC